MGRKLSPMTRLESRPYVLDKIPLEPFPQLPHWYHERSLYEAFVIPFDACTGVVCKVKAAEAL
jgi:hypothetical protein